jgi:hypothetical protein
VGREARKSKEKCAWPTLPLTRWINQSVNKLLSKDILNPEEPTCSLCLSPFIYLLFDYFFFSRDERGTIIEMRLGRAISSFTGRLRDR